MKRYRTKLALFIILFVAAGIFRVHAFGYAGSPEAARKLIVFYSPGCHKCMEVQHIVMPEIEKKFGGVLSIEYRDISDVENYKALLALGAEYGVQESKLNVPMVFFEGKFLSGKEEVSEKLKDLLKVSLARQLPAVHHQFPKHDLLARFKEFKPLAVISAGLADGINPCAFTVIIFFISFLALQGYKKKELIFIGMAFITAVFLTYLSIGVGIFNFLYRLKGFWVVTNALNISIGIVSIALGVLTLYDVFCFRRTGKTEGLLLQLPAAVKNRIHGVVGYFYRRSNRGSSRTQACVRPHIMKLTLSALITGFLVSLLEAVCTGQLYVPTIVFVLKTTELKLRALQYLILYNIMFIVPLFAIFVLALWGTTSEQFSRFLRRHLVLAKVIMAVLFFGMGILLIGRL